MTRQHHHWKIVLATAALLCTLSRLESANAFQTHVSLSSPSLAVKIPNELIRDRQSVLVWKPKPKPHIRSNSIRSSIHSSTQLGALPAASTLVASAGSLLATIGNILVPSSSPMASKILRVIALFMAGTLVVSQNIRQRTLWPGLTAPQSKDSEPLPGPMGCPFLGTPWIYTSASTSYGGGNHYRKVAHSLGRKLGAVPRIWKYYMMGTPFAVLSGGKTFQKVLNMEFDGSLTSSGVDLMDGGLLSTQSLFFEPSKKRHTYLRRLVGAALTPNAVAKNAHSLQSASELQVQKMVQQASAGNEVKFHQVCTDYTLDVAWRQILGLQLTDDEIPIFEQNVATWIEGIMSLQVLFRFRVESHPGYKAREYVISKIEERIDQLLEQGPDSQSTLSGMVFATDEEDPTKKLTRQEVIDNAMILIFAGSETSASTLTNAMLFAGLHPSVWNNLVEEQSQIRAVHGETLTPASLDATNAPYLDAFLKETMRMRTVVSGIPRTALRDIDVDGDGKTVIPKGYLVDPSMLLTHEEDPNVKLPDGMHLDAIQGFRPERWLASNSNSPSKDNSSPRPDNDWYVPYGFGPRYCLGKNLAQLEMKIFLATMARKLDFPVLSMLPQNYDYSPNKKQVGDDDYFSVEWSTSGAVIPTAGDGVLASVTAKQKATTSFPVYSLDGVSNSTTATTTVEN